MNGEALQRHLDPIYEIVQAGLALQGGGACGAFTGWGLDRLLEEPWLRCDDVFGASTKAMNAAALAGGFVESGAQWEVISMLRNEGRKAAEEFLLKHGSDIGDRSTVDLNVLLDQV